MNYSIYGTTGPKPPAGIARDLHRIEGVHPHPIDQCGIFVMTDGGFKKVSEKPKD